MISFFRKIRQKLLSQNRVTQYLAYAVGEIFLVVIGILIALWINNLNEAKKAENSQLEMLSSFLEDLKVEASTTENHLEDMSRILEVHQRLYELRKGHSTMKDLANPGLIRGSIRYSSIVLLNNPDFGSKVVNPKIKEEVLKYYQRLSRAENSYQQFDQVIKELVRPFMRELHLMNEDFFFLEKNPDEGIIFPIDLENLSNAIDSPDFGQILLEANLKAHELTANLEGILVENEELAKNITTYISSK